MKKAWMAAALLFVLTAAGMGIGLAAQKNGQKDEKEWREIHLGMFLENPVSFSEGETMEDNRFLDWIRRDLGIRVTYDWIYSKDEFQRNIDLYIACDMLPDALLVEEKQYRQMLEYDLLQPVTEVYRDMASDQLKAYVGQYGRTRDGSSNGRRGNDGDSLPQPYRQRYQSYVDPTGLAG